MNNKSFLLKIKEIGNMDIKDIGIKLKKNKVNTYYKDNIKKNKYREKPKTVLSIDLGSNLIKAAEGRIKGNIINVNKLINIETPKGAIIDGKIIYENLIISTLDKLIKENNIKAKNIIFTTNSSSIINRDILIPIVDEDEMDTVVRYEMQQYLPINLDDYIIKFVILDKIVDDEGIKLKINVTAFPEKIALGYYNIINSLGLNPYILDVTYNSINKLANYEDYTLNRGKIIGGIFAFVDIGTTSIKFSILKNGKLDFTRILKISDNNIKYFLREKMNKSIEEEEFKNFKHVDLLNNSYKNLQTLTIKGIIDEVLEELDRAIQFYNNKSNSNIDKIYIFGGMSNIKNIDSYLSEKLNINVSKIKEIKNVNLGNEILFNRDLFLYLNAIGAMIRL